MRVSVDKHYTTSSLHNRIVCPITNELIIPSEDARVVYNKSDGSLYYSDDNQWIKIIGECKPEVVNISSLEAGSVLKNLNLVEFPNGACQIVASTGIDDIVCDYKFVDTTSEGVPVIAIRGSNLSNNDCEFGYTSGKDLVTINLNKALRIKTTEKTDVKDLEIFVKVPDSDSEIRRHTFGDIMNDFLTVSPPNYKSIDLDQSIKNIIENSEEICQSIQNCVYSNQESPEVIDQKFQENVLVVVNDNLDDCLFPTPEFCDAVKTAIRDDVNSQTSTFCAKVEECFDQQDLCNNVQNCYNDNIIETNVTSQSFDFEPWEVAFFYPEDVPVLAFSIPPTPPPATPAYGPPPPNPLVPYTTDDIFNLVNNFSGNWWQIRSDFDQISFDRNRIDPPDLPFNQVTINASSIDNNYLVLVSWEEVELHLNTQTDDPIKNVARLIVKYCLNYTIEGDPSNVYESGWTFGGNHDRRVGKRVPIITEEYDLISTKRSIIASSHSTKLFVPVPAGKFLKLEPFIKVFAWGLIELDDPFDLGNIPASANLLLTLRHVGARINVVRVPDPKSLLDSETNYCQLFPELIPPTDVFFEPNIDILVKETEGVVCETIAASIGDVIIKSDIPTEDIGQVVVNDVRYLSRILDESKIKLRAVRPIDYFNNLQIIPTKILPGNIDPEDVVVVVRDGNVAGSPIKFISANQINCCQGVKEVTLEALTDTFCTLPVIEDDESPAVPVEEYNILIVEETPAPQSACNFRRINLLDALPDILRYELHSLEFSPSNEFTVVSSVVQDPPSHTFLTSFFHPRVFPAVLENRALIDEFQTSLIIKNILPAYDAASSILEFLLITTTSIFSSIPFIGGLISGAINEIKRNIYSIIDIQPEYRIILRSRYIYEDLTEDIDTYSIVVRGPRLLSGTQVNYPISLRNIRKVLRGVTLQSTLIIDYRSFIGPDDFEADNALGIINDIVNALSFASSGELTAFQQSFQNFFLDLKQTFRTDITYSTIEVQN